MVTAFEARETKEMLHTNLLITGLGGVCSGRESPEMGFLEPQPGPLGFPFPFPEWVAQDL